MTLRPGELPGRAIAVFPFLKTTDPIQLGSFSFRSTDDTSDLEKGDASNVRQFSDMLFLKDDLRIRSASCHPRRPTPERRQQYGRMIFQLCVGSVLFGTHLAQRSALHDKLTTNQERLELICKSKLQRLFL
jgi:hypothetical protein